MGERKRRLKNVAVAVKQAVDDVANSSAPMNVVTPGGKIQVQWDTKSNATAMGQLAFFAEFLEVAGLFERWVKQCPLYYTSPNAPNVRDVLGTWMLSILDGHRRYAHVASLRGDAVATQILGMSRIVGDESLRRALAQIAPKPNTKHNEEERAAQQTQVQRAWKWMDQALLDSVQHALGTPWILDTDATVKTLFGNQEGAEVGYNPHKPGRPSHTVHTYWIANLRLVLQAIVQGGKSGSAAHSLPGLIELLLRLPVDQRPKLVRGDCAFGNEGVMRELEDIDQPYLFKLRQSPNVKRLIERQFRRADWCDAGQSWQACEDSLMLSGWTCARRVVVMRRAIKDNLIAETVKPRRAGRKPAKKGGSAPTQLALYLPDENGPVRIWEYVVLVTNGTYGAAQIAQLYRDRADCENGFDELKNMWGWGGYSTQDIERCNLSARAVALIYNWWSWYVRLAHPKARLEAITSRPLLLAAVGRLTESGGQRRILLSLTHAAASHVKALVTNVRKGLDHIRTTAPQLPSMQRWNALVQYIVDKIIAATAPFPANGTAPPRLATG
jgi:hypothetical protein